MNKTIEYQNVQENLKYKDTLFRRVFNKKEDLLELYNAVNGTDYQNPEDLEVNTLAMDECIKEGILKDILTRQKSEVLGMLLSTFNKELYEKNLKEDAYNEGKSAGKIEGKIEGIREQLREKIQIKLAKGKTVEEIADALEEDVETIRELMES